MLSKNPDLILSHCWASNSIHEILQKFHFTQIFHWETKKANYSELGRKAALSGNCTCSSNILLCVYEVSLALSFKTRIKPKNPNGLYALKNTPWLGVWVVLVWFVLVFGVFFLCCYCRWCRDLLVDSPSSLLGNATWELSARIFPWNLNDAKQNTWSIKEKRNQNQGSRCSHWKT